MPHTKNIDAETDHTLQIVRRFSDAFNDHAVDRVMELMTDDCVFENTHPKPNGKRLEGSAAVRGYWQYLFRVSPKANFATEDLFAHRDRAVLRWRYTWQTTDGRTCHIRGVDLFRVRDGRVSEKLSYVKG